MLLTEDEAKERWCPFARGKSSDDYCIASQCMAWRNGPTTYPKRRMWNDGRPECEHFPGCGPIDWNDPTEPPKPDGVPPSWRWEFEPADPWCGWIEPDAEAELRQPGYCGLAGKP